MAEKAKEKETKAVAPRSREKDGTRKGFLCCQGRVLGG
jgi:hypothetical protein